MKENTAGEKQRDLQLGIPWAESRAGEGGGINGGAPTESGQAPGAEGFFDSEPRRALRARTEKRRVSSLRMTARGINAEAQRGQAKLRDL